MKIKNRNVNFNEPTLIGKEIKHIKNIFKKNYFQSNGSYSVKCEKLIKNIVNKKNILMTDSATSALEMTALAIRDFSKKQEIILPSYTFTTTASSFLKLGFSIKFADVDPDNMMINLENIKKLKTNYTKAVIVVHYGAFCINLSKILKYCKNNNIYLIEDAAQAFGSKKNNNFYGTIGDFGCYSFHETKNIHSGLGGALYVKNKKDFQKCLQIRERGTNRNEVIKGLKKKYSWTQLGGSYAPTELQMAFLFPQLESYQSVINKRKKIFNRYSEKLKLLLIKKFIYYPLLNKYYNSNYHAFWIRLNSEKSTNSLIKYMKKNNINLYIGYVPLHNSRVGRKFGLNNKLINTEKYSKLIIRLPLHNSLNIKMVDYICDYIYKFFYENK